MTNCCHIFALVLAILALLCAVVGVAAPWTVAAADLSTANVQQADVKVDQQVVLLTLWRRYEHHTEARSTSEAWQHFFSGKGSRRYCPEGDDFQGAWDRIQAAEAMSIICTAFIFLYIVVTTCYASGHCLSRCLYTLMAFLAIVSAALAIMSWFLFLNYCDDAYCSEYLGANTGQAHGSFTAADLFHSGSQQLTDEAYCYSYVGFGFEVAAMGLVLLSWLLMCIGGRPYHHHHHHSEHVVHDTRTTTYDPQPVTLVSDPYVNNPPRAY
jgi:hypothetical protein